jgi:tRNA(Ile)-lysidine synthase
MISPSLIKHSIPANSTLIVGFSGGPDSVCLLTFLSELAPKLNVTIIAAHLDHQWRPESAQDSLWCKNFCLTLNDVTFVSQTITELNFDSKYNGSKEEFARNLRRCFFQDLALKYQASHIVLAHHADDQLETFFIRLARGSSVTGLTAMKEEDRTYLRPLLKVKKEEILNYLHHHKIAYLTDSTNIDPKYLRNRIRYQLIPTLCKVDERFENNIANCMTHLQKTDQFLDQITLETIEKISTQNLINIKLFLDLHEILQHRILMHLLIQHKIKIIPSSALFEEIIRFLHATKSLQHQIHQQCSIIKQSNHFYFKSL